MLQLNNTVLTTLVALIALSYLILVPPFQVPDEQNHFYRSYQISEGMFFARKIGKIDGFRGEHTGGDLPKALSEINEQFRKISFNPNRDLDKINFQNAWQVRIDPHDRLPYTYSNTSLFSFISYLAPATGIQIASFFTDRALAQFYAARLASLLMAVFCFWLACHLYAPFRLVFFLLTLVPMNIHQLVAISSDAYTNSIALLFIASVLQLFSTQPNNSAYKTITMLTGALLACGKQIATPILGIMIFIRRKVFSNTGMYFSYLFFFYLICALIILFWALKAQEIYNPLYWHPNTDAQAQFEHVLEHPSDVFTMFMEMIQNNAVLYLRDGIGAKLGYLDTFPPEWTITLYKILAVLLIVLHPRLPEITIPQALGFLAICILGIIVVKLALYINTSPVGAGHNKHVHGRYFITYFGLAMAAFIQLFPKSRALTRKVYPGLCILSIGAILITTATILWSVTQRFYY